MKKKSAEDYKTINAMIQLLKKQPTAIPTLERIRINPQLNKMQLKDKSGKKRQVKLRCDLEFYIP